MANVHKYTDFKKTQQQLIKFFRSIMYKATATNMGRQHSWYQHFKGMARTAEMVTGPSYYEQGT